MERGRNDELSHENAELAERDGANPNRIGG